MALLPLALSVLFVALALARFFDAARDTHFLASGRVASKATFGLAATLALFAIPLVHLDAEVLLVPLGVFGLAGLFLAPPTPRYSFLLAMVAFVLALGASGAHLVFGAPWGVLVALPVAIAFGHLPLPGRPSLRFLLALPFAALVAFELPSPLLLAPVPLILFAVPSGPPYEIVPEDGPWDHKMMYYLSLGGVLLAATVALWAGAGGPLVDPALDQAQVTVALIAAALLLVPILKIAFKIVGDLGAAPD